MHASTPFMLSGVGENLNEHSARDEVMRLRALLWECRTAPSGDTRSHIRQASTDPSFESTPIHEDILEQALSEYRRRRLRSRIFGGFKFDSEPAWDMMLDLLIHSPRGPIRTTSACIASAVPATTALRHLDLLEKAGLIVSVVDEHDARARNVCLTHKSLERFAEYFVSAKHK